MTYKIVIQARLGSTRLKNKMITPFYGEKKLIEVILHNLLNDFDSSEIILATSDLPENKILGNIANKLGIDTYYGSESDVLSRFIDVGKKYKLDYVIRVCADNPLIQNESIKNLILNYDEKDYVSYFYSDNTPSIKTHSGFFTEMVRVDTLIKIKELTNDMFYHEHVTNYIYENEDIFNIASMYEFFIIFYKCFFHRNSSFLALPKSLRYFFRSSNFSFFSLLLKSLMYSTRKAQNIAKKIAILTTRIHIRLRLGLTFLFWSGVIGGSTTIKL